MSDNLPINLHPTSLNFLSLLKILYSSMREAISSGARATIAKHIVPVLALRGSRGKQSRLTSKSHIRSSSSRGTNISSSAKSASLIPDYLVPVPHSPIRSSKKSAIFYSILFVKTQISLEGGFEPDLNGFL